MRQFIYIHLVLLFILISNSLSSQTELKTETMILKGEYFGKNIYIQNPYIAKGTDTIFTAQQILVNDSLVLNKMQLQKSTFSIPLTKLHLKEGNDIIIKIIQCDFNRVRILNPVMH